MSAGVDALAVQVGKGSGIFVVDVDDLIQLETLEVEHGELSTARRAGSGGLHLHFQWNPPASTASRTRESLLGEPGIEVLLRGRLATLPQASTQAEGLLLAQGPQSLRAGSANSDRSIGGVSA